ncbi:hypothetical protein HO498_05995 [Streptococcus suis]|nr:hypothetical protein [Streptococcus suis]
MTLLVSWIGVDTHGTSSAYITTDSRISWGSSNYDYGKKVFTSSLYPELFGYAGDVLFPTLVLSQVIELIDNDLLLNENMDCKRKSNVIIEKIRYSLAKYPEQQLGNNPIQIIHISRDTNVDGVLYPKFYCYMHQWKKADGWTTTEITLGNESGILTILGSGRKEFAQMYDQYQQKGNTSTSRNVFQCFVDTLETIKDSYCGGAPQMVGLYRKPFTNGKTFGILYKNKRYVLGMEVPKHSEFSNISWRNELFEICDGNSKKIAENAMRQPNPLGCKN